MCMIRSMLLLYYGISSKTEPDVRVMNPFRTAVPFRGQTSQNLRSLSPERTAVLKGWVLPDRYECLCT